MADVSMLVAMVLSVLSGIAALASLVAVWLELHRKKSSEHEKKMREVEIRYKDFLLEEERSLPYPQEDEHTDSTDIEEKNSPETPR